MKKLSFLSNCCFLILTLGASLIAQTPIADSQLNSEISLRALTKNVISRTPEQTVLYSLLNASAENLFSTETQRLDSTFNDDGMATYDFNNTTDYGNDAAVQPDGKILLVGRTTLPGANSAFALIRLNSDGSYDTNFGTNGKVTADVTPGFDEAWSAVVQPDGKILVAGNSNLRSNRVVMRFNPDGSVDANFGSGGVFSTPLGAFLSVDEPEMVLQADGKIVVAGATRLGVTTEAFGVLRLNANGTLDTTFDGDGQAVTTFLGTDLAADVKIQPDGKIVAAGQTNPTANPRQFALARYNVNGSLDSTFDGDGKVITNFAGNPVSFALDFQTDGKIVAAGRTISSPERAVVMRFHQNGSLDTTFGGVGAITYEIQGRGNQGFNNVLVKNGKIIATGWSFAPGNSNRAFLFWRINENGSTDGPISIFDFTAGDDQSLDAELQPDGKLLMAGYAANLAPTGFDFAAARLFLGSTRFDFDGDSKSDISVFRPSSGGWYINSSSSGSLTALQFGANGDLIAPADFDGDSKADICVFRPSNGGWYRLNSSNNAFVAAQFGANGDLPVAGDFDADGKADIAVFRPANGAWYRLNSSNGQFVAQQFGANGDKPQVGDFDGDGKSDLAVFRPSTGAWYVLRSSDNSFYGVGFGQNGDVPTTADFDGDGRADIAVYRASVGGWYRLNSSNGQFVAQQFGIAEDKPVAADYDGDGRSDVAVFRPSNGTWYLNRSTAQFTAVQFGASGDAPAPAAFGQ